VTILQDYQFVNVMQSSGYVKHCRCYVFFCHYCSFSISPKCTIKVVCAWEWIFHCFILCQLFTVYHKFCWL